MSVHSMSLRSESSWSVGSDSMLASSAGGSDSTFSMGESLHDAVDGDLFSGRTGWRHRLEKVEKFVFDVLYGMVSGTTSFAIVSLFVLFVELFQMIGFALDRRFVWGAAADSVIPFFEYATLRVIDTDFWVYRVVTATVYAILTLSVANAVYVGRSFSRQAVALLPLRIQRVVVAFLLTALYIPMMMVLLTPFNCDRTLTPPQLRDYPGIDCDSAEVVVYKVVGSVWALLLLVSTLALTLVFYQDSLKSSHLMARPHARVDVATHFSKSCLLIAQAVAATELYFFAALLLVLMIVVFALQVLFLPYYNAKMQAARTGTYALMTWLGLCTLMTTLVNGTSESDRASAGNEVFIVTIVVAPFAYALGCAACYGWRWLLLRHYRRDNRVGLSESTGFESTAAIDPPKFYVQADCEIVARVLYEQGHVEEANSVFHFGFLQFPKSAFLHLSYARFLAALGNTAMARVYVTRSMRTKAWPDMRFSRYRRSNEIARAERAHQLTSGGMDLVSFIEFQNKFRLAKRAHVAASRRIANFWRALFVSDANFARTSATMIRRIDRATTAADTSYRDLIRKFPTSVALFESYAHFLEDVSHNLLRADKCFRRADALRADRERREREGARHLDLGNGLISKSGAGPDLNRDSAALITITSRGIITTCNKRFLQLVGYAGHKRELLGQHLNMVTPHPYDDWHDAWMAADIAKIESGDDLDAGHAAVQDALKVRHITLLHKSGRHVFVDIRFNHTMSGKTHVYVGLMAERFDPFVSLEVDSSGTIWATGPAVTPLMGYEPHELNGQSINMLLPVALRDQHDTYMFSWSAGNAERREKSPVVGDEIWRTQNVRHKSGLLFPVILHIELYATMGSRFMLWGQLHPVTLHTFEVTVSDQNKILSTGDNVQRLFGKTERALLGQSIGVLFRLPQSETLIDEIYNRTWMRGSTITSAREYELGRRSAPQSTQDALADDEHVWFKDNDERIAVLDHIRTHIDAVNTHFQQFVLSSGGPTSPPPFLQQLPGTFESFGDHLYLLETQPATPTCAPVYCLAVVGISHEDAGRPETRMPTSPTGSAAWGSMSVARPRSKTLRLLLHPLAVPMRDPDVPAIQTHEPAGLQVADSGDMGEMPEAFRPSPRLLSKSASQHASAALASPFRVTTEDAPGKRDRLRRRSSSRRARTRSLSSTKRLGVRAATHRGDMRASTNTLRTAVSDLSGDVSPQLIGGSSSCHRTSSSSSSASPPPDPLSSSLPARRRTSERRFSGVGSARSPSPDDGVSLVSGGDQKMVSSVRKHHRGRRRAKLGERVALRERQFQSGFASHAAVRRLGRRMLLVILFVVAMTAVLFTVATVLTQSAKEAPVRAYYAVKRFHLLAQVVSDMQAMVMTEEIEGVALARFYTRVNGTLNGTALPSFDLSSTFLDFDSASLYFLDFYDTLQAAFRINVTAYAVDTDPDAYEESARAARPRASIEVDDDASEVAALATVWAFLVGVTDVVEESVDELERAHDALVLGDERIGVIQDVYDPSNDLVDFYLGTDSVELLHFVDVRGGMFSDKPITFSPRTYNLYRAVNVFIDTVRDYIELVRVVRGVFEDPTISAASLEAMQDLSFFVIYNGRTVFQSVLEHAVSLEELVVRNRLTRDVTIIVSVTGAVTLLFLVGVFVLFLPSVRRAVSLRHQATTIFLSIPKRVVVGLHRSATRISRAVREADLDDASESASASEVDASPQAQAGVANSADYGEGMLGGAGVADSRGRVPHLQLGGSNLSMVVEQQEEQEEQEGARKRRRRDGGGGTGTGTGTRKPSSSSLTYTYTSGSTSSSSLRSGSSTASSSSTSSTSPIAAAPQHRQGQGRGQGRGQVRGQGQRLGPGQGQRQVIQMSEMTPPPVNVIAATPGGATSGGGSSGGGTLGGGPLSVSDTETLASLHDTPSRVPRVSFGATLPLMDVARTSADAPSASPAGGGGGDGDGDVAEAREPSVASSEHGASTPASHPQQEWEVERDEVDRRQNFVSVALLFLALVILLSTVGIVDLIFVGNITKVVTFTGARLPAAEMLRNDVLLMIIQENAVFENVTRVVYPIDYVDWGSETVREEVAFSAPRFPERAAVTLGEHLRTLVGVDAYLSINKDGFKVPSQSFLNEPGQCLRRDGSCRDDDDPYKQYTRDGLYVLMSHVVRQCEILLRADHADLVPETKEIWMLQELVPREVRDGLHTSAEYFAFDAIANSVWDIFPLLVFLTQALFFASFYLFVLVPLLRLLRVQHHRTMFMLSLIPQSVVDSVPEIAEYMGVDEDL